jgi:histone-lysine N-methyltransferase SETMAR
VLLTDKLKLAICMKQRGQLSQTVNLQHDRACLHTASKTLETIQGSQFELLEHPPYSLDLVPCDFHVFGPLNYAVRGAYVSNDGEVENAVHSCLHTRPKLFFFLAESQSWFNVGPSALKRGKTM